jgi:predicted nucleotidyltransferase
MSTLFPKAKERIIEFIVDNPSKKMKVRELAKLLKISPAYVSRTLKTLVRDDVIKDNKVNLSNPYVRVLKIFFNIKKLIDKNTIRKLKKLKVLGAGIYGSWANGTNFEDSDLDIWIKTSKRLEEINIATTADEIRKGLGTNVQILVLTPERIERLKKEDPIFYYSLVFGSIKLYGEEIE